MFVPVASEYITGVKTTAQDKADAEVASHKASLEKELSQQLATLAADKESTLKAVEGSVNDLAKDIIAKVINFGYYCLRSSKWTLDFSPVAHVVMYFALTGSSCWRYHLSGKTIVLVSCGLSV